MATLNLDNEIHDESEFETSYTEVEVADETDFNTRKANLYTKTGDVDLSKADNKIVFRYYNDNGNLQDLETVPIISDGVSVGIVKEYYIRTSTSDTPDKNASGWSETPPAFDGTNKYLWNYESNQDSRGREITATNAVLISANAQEILSLVEYYQRSNSTSAPSTATLDNWSTTPQATTEGKYLYNFELITYPDGSSIKTSVQVISANGDRGALNGGTEETTLPVDGDFYLDTTNDVIKIYKTNSWHSYEYGSEGDDYCTKAEINSKWMESINIAVSTAKTSGNIFNATSAFIASLIANSAFIENLAAKIITMQTGGIIKSSNYNGTVNDNGEITDYGSAGWAIDNLGKADFTDMQANGGTFNNIFIGEGANFAGYIASGPLYLDDEDPSSLESQTTFDAGTSWETVESYLGFSLSEVEDSKIYGLYNGLWGSTGFSYLQRTFDTYYGPMGMPSFRTYLKFLSRKQETLITVQVWDSNNGYLTTSLQLIFNLYTPGGKTLKLKNLPTNKSTLTGMVYQDSEGYLRIS